MALSWQSSADALAAATGAPATSEAYAYHLQVTTAGDPDFSGKPVDDALVDQTSYVSKDKTYGDGSFLWRRQCGLSSIRVELAMSARSCIARSSTDCQLPCGE